MSGFVIVCKKRKCPHPKQNSFLTYFFNYRARAVLNYSLEPSESLYMSRIQEVGPEGSFHEFLKENWNAPGFHLFTRKHFYHVGSTEDLRHPMIEALITNFAATPRDKEETWIKRLYAWYAPRFFQPIYDEIDGAMASDRTR